VSFRRSSPVRILQTSALITSSEAEREREREREKDWEEEEGNSGKLLVQPTS